MLGTICLFVLAIWPGFVWFAIGVAVYDYGGGVFSPEEARRYSLAGWMAALMVPVVLASVAIQVSALAKRLRDIGASLFWLVLILHPLSGLIVMTMLCLLPTDIVRNAGAIEEGILASVKSATANNKQVPRSKKTRQNTGKDSYL